MAEKTLFNMKPDPIPEKPVEDTGRVPAPLPDRIRPRTLDEFVGQGHLLGEEGVLRKAIRGDRVPSMILWGPPGTGKTTLAQVISHETRGDFVSLSAVTSGVKDLREVVARAKQTRKKGKKTILFVDEIHRWNRAQQDGFLPHVEDGTIILIGATTENPSFFVISALLSRCRVFTLNPLEKGEIETILRRAITDPDRGIGNISVQWEDSGIGAIVAGCDGDARRALSDLELVARVWAEQDPPQPVTGEFVGEALRSRTLLYDKEGEEHYNLISALHKSVRASDPDAAMYWLARMLASGEEPLYVARRLVRMAVEDIGMADPQALPLAVSAMECFRFLGSPEGELALAEAAVYLACAPKSNSLEAGYIAARREIEASGSLPVPPHLRNAPTPLMKDLGYGDGYVYDHDTPDGFSGQACLPERIQSKRFYKPTDRGEEKGISRRLQAWEALRRKHRGEA